jgi:hypothetical protein
MVGDMVNTINYRQADGIVVGSYRTESNRVIQQSADTARFPFDIMQFVSLYKPEKIVAPQVAQSNSCSGSGCLGVIQRGEINTQQSQPVVVQVSPSPITQDKSSLISLCKSLSNAEAKLECMENIIKQEDVGKVTIPSSSTQIAQAPLVQEEYVPPQEYIVDAPLYYDMQPGVAFYPIYIDTPGSCFCVMPMRYYGGVWLGVTGEVIYRGFFPYRRAEPHHRTVYLQRTIVVNGFSPHRGRFESVGGRVVVLPPVGTMHHQVAIAC